MAEKSTRFISLDLLRGIAAIGIVVYHTLHENLPFLSPLYLCVDLFFVLSGFVLFPIYPNQLDMQSVGNFIKKRALRFWPMSIAALLFSVIWIMQQSNTGNIALDKYGDDPAISFLGALLLLQIFSATATQWIVPLWSLSAEWITNLIAIPFIKVRKDYLFVLMSVFGFALMLLGLQMNSEQISKLGPVLGSIALGRAFTGFFIGVLIRIYFERLSQNKWVANKWSSLLGIALLYLAAHKYGYSSVLIASILVVPSIIFLATKNEQIANGALRRIAVTTGALSFGIYVWQMPLRDVLIGLFPKIGIDTSNGITHGITDSLKLFVGTLVLSVIATLITQRVIEQPIQTRFGNSKNRLNK